MKNPVQMTKTRRAAASAPGSVNGRTTYQNILTGVASTLSRAFEVAIEAKHDAQNRKHGERQDKLNHPQYHRRDAGDQSDWRGRESYG